MASRFDPTRPRSLILLAALAVAFLAAQYLRHVPAVEPARNPSQGECWTKHEINSREYWDCRFATRDWQRRHGGAQSEYFYGLLVDLIPEPVKAEMRAGGYSVVDFGCAQGEGTERFAEAFPASRVTGVDISVEAIRLARAKSKRVEFVAADLTAHPGTWDVLITSNTLEHFREPWDMMQRLLPRVGRFFIILVPFNERLLPQPNEHFYSFNRDNIPRAVGRFKLIYSAVVATPPKWWPGEQVMLIYAAERDASDGAGAAGRDLPRTK